MHPVKLNQNFIYKRTKIKKFISTFESANKRKPTIDEISEGVSLSAKVITNILNVNNGEDFQFISFQAVNDNASDDATNENYVENKLVAEYLDQTVSDDAMTNYELRDLLTALKTKVDERDYNMFIDKHLNNMSYSDIAKKYGLNFPSSSKYIIERTEKICKELLS